VEVLFFATEGAPTKGKRQAKISERAGIGVNRGNSETRENYPKLYYQEVNDHLQKMSPSTYAFTEGASAAIREKLMGGLREVFNCICVVKESSRIKREREREAKASTRLK